MNNALLDNCFLIVNLTVKEILLDEFNKIPPKNP